MQRGRTRRSRSSSTPMNPCVAPALICEEEGKKKKEKGKRRIEGEKKERKRS